MPISQRSDAKRLRAPRWPRGLVPWKMTVQTFLEKIAGMVGAQIEIIGADRVTMGPDGSATFNVPGGAGEAGCEYAWTPTFVSNVSSNDRVTLNVGTLNTDFLITIDDAAGGGDTDIMDSPPPQLAIPDTGTQIVYLEVTGAVTTPSGSTFVTGFAPTSATIEVGTSVPSSTQTVQRIELFRWSAGALVNQARKYNLILHCQASGSDTTLGVFTWLPGG